MELNPPFINEPKVKDLPELTIIPPAEIIPPTTLGELPFGFVPIIELPCVVARDKKLGTGTGMFNSDPEGSQVLCINQPFFVAPDAYEDLPIQKAERPYELLNSLNDETEEVEEKDSSNNQKGNTNVSQNFNQNINSNLNGEPLPCPPPDNKYPLGALGKYGTARVKGFQVDLTNGKCVTLWEPLGKLEVLDNYSPPPALVASTFTVALFGASAALFASPLTKIIIKTLKPISKKLIKAVKAKLGKTEKVLSKAERMKAQREKTMVARMWSSLRK